MAFGTDAFGGSDSSKDGQPMDASGPAAASPGTNDVTNARRMSYAAAAAAARTDGT